VLFAMAKHLLEQSISQKPKKISMFFYAFISGVDLMMIEAYKVSGVSFNLVH